MMNDRAIEILTPLLGDIRARETCALVSMAEVLAALGDQHRELQRQVAELEAKTAGLEVAIRERHEEGGETP